MTAAFNKILVPVDFSLNTELAVKKAAGLAGPGETQLHLVHVVKPGKRPSRQFKGWAAEKELERIGDGIRLEHPGLRVKTYILRGSSIQRMLIEGVALLKPDLIIIGKQNSRRRWSLTRHISPDVIARKSKCPVLTVKPGSLETRVRVIVIPIRDFLPERKLEWAVLLAKKYRAQVHLLAIQGSPGLPGMTGLPIPREWALPNVFLQAYHHLREQLRHPIEYSSAGRRNPARAALNYAEGIRADMILVNPETESGVQGFTGWRHMSDLLARDSRIQILDLEPYAEKPK